MFIKTWVVQLLVCVVCFISFKTALQAEDKIPVQNKQWFKKQVFPLVQWKFSFKEFEKIDSNQIALADNNRLVKVPHTWNALDVLDDVPGYYKGVGIYECILPAASLNNKDKYLLHFEGANSNTKVFVNGRLVGEHKGGYSAFEFDISNFLLGSKANLLKVEVDNQLNDCVPPLSADYNFYGGIYRPVYLLKKKKEAGFKRNLACADIEITYPKVFKNEAEIELNINLEGNYAGKFIAYRLASSAKKSAKNILTKGEERVLKQSNVVKISVRGIELWTPENPVLYPLTILLTDAKRNVLDSISYKVAFRTYSFSADSGFFLNGKPLKLQGTNRHQDWWQKGWALTPAQHLVDARLIKSSGANFVRVSHYPQAKEFLNACDSLGLLVWEEIPLVNKISLNDCFTESAMQQLEEMIVQHRHHPSIIIWGYMNEIFLQMKYGPESEQKRNLLKGTYELALKLNARAKLLDRARFTAIAFEQDSSTYAAYRLTEVPDILAWNLYAGWYGFKTSDFGLFLDAVHRKHPNKYLMVSEYGAGTDKRIYSNSPELFDFSQEWALKFYQDYLLQMDARAFVAGGAQWNFIDFQAEPRGDAMPHINNKGMVYANRLPKSIFYLFKAFWDKKERFAYFLSEPSNKRVLLLPAGKDVFQDSLRFFSNELSLSITLNGTKMLVPIVNGLGKVAVPLKAGFNRLSYFNGSKLIETSIEGVALNPYDKHFRWQFNLGAKFHLYEATQKKFWVGTEDVHFKKLGILKSDGLAHRPNSWFGRRPAAEYIIKGSDVAPVHQTMLDSVSTIEIKITEPGAYGLILHFAELHASPATKVFQHGAVEAGKGLNMNEFDVYINNQKAFAALNPAVEAGENAKALQKIVAFDVTPDDFLKFQNRIIIQFKATKGSAFCNALELERIK